MRFLAVDSMTRIKEQDLRFYSLRVVYRLQLIVEQLHMQPAHKTYQPIGLGLGLFTYIGRHIKQQKLPYVYVYVQAYILIRSINI